MDPINNDLSTVTEQIKPINSGLIEKEFIDENSMEYRLGKSIEYSNYLAKNFNHLVDYVEYLSEVIKILQPEEIKFLTYGDFINKEKEENSSQK